MQEIQHVFRAGMWVVAAERGGLDKTDGSGALS
jgi:hypothetical protein